MILIQLLFGWPAIICFMALATIGAFKSNKKLMVVALIWSLPNTYFISGYNGWIQFAVLYLPISFGVSVYLVESKWNIVPKLLLIPAYAFYAALGLAVVNQ